MKRALFIDTWAFRALADAADPAHEAAFNLDERMEREKVARITTDYVLDEALTGLRSRGGIAVASRFLDEIEALVDSRALRIERVDDERFRKAAELFRHVNGKFPRLSFTDCTSFVVMRDEGLVWAFTADPHFDSVGQDLHAVFALDRNGRVKARSLPFISSSGFLVG